MIKILLANDDGHLAPGLHAFYERLISFAEVTVVVPETNCSGASSSLTLNRPLSIGRAANGFYLVNGTPVDCVHLALTGLLDQRPDMVISGINNGGNIANDLIYSGTFGAALEGYMFGIPSVAFSLQKKGWSHLDAAVVRASEIVQKLMRQKPLPHVLFNINIPNLSYEKVAGITITRPGTRHPSESSIPAQSPGGDKMFWIGSSGKPLDCSEGTDIYALDHDYVSVSPIQLQFSDMTMQECCKQWFTC